MLRPPFRNNRAAFRKKYKFPDSSFGNAVCPTLFVIVADQGPLFTSHKSRERNILKRPCIYVYTHTSVYVCVCVYLEEWEVEEGVRERQGDRKGGGGSHVIILARVDRIFR